MAVATVATVGIAAVGHATLSFAAGACDQVPVPAQKVQMLGRDMTINGVPTQAALMTFNQSSAQVTASFMQFWQQQKAAAHTLDDGHQVLLSAVTDGCSYTLQLPSHASAPVTGLFSTMQLNQDLVSTPRALRDALYPLPAGRVVLDMVSHDHGTQARTLQIVLPEQSLQQAVQRYTQRLAAQGWRALAQGSAMQPSQAAAQGFAMAMQKDGYRLDAAFTKTHSSTTAVINVAFHG